MLSTRERCEKRLQGLKSARLPYEAEWREIAQFAQPSRSRFLNSESGKNFRRINKAIYNSHGILAFRTLTGGMTSGLSSPSRPWFRLAPYESDAMGNQDVKEWMAEVEKRMYAFLAQTNFYGAVKSGYAELGMFGTEACVMVEHWREGAVCHPLTAGEYWIGLSDAAKPDTLYRRIAMTVVQTVQSFGRDKVSQLVRDQYDRADYEQIVNVMHAIEPNMDRNGGDMQASKGKPWMSFYWDEHDGDKVNGCLRCSGMDEQPFWAPRWETVGGDAYGTSPGMDALPDLRELQLQTKRKTEATAFLVKPEKIVPPQVKLTGQAGNIVSAASVDAQGVIVPYHMPYQAIAAIVEDIKRCEMAVDQLSFADIFNAITNMQGIQPRTVEEIASRNEEKMTQLGPVIERVNNEKLQVAIDRTFGIMHRAGMLPEAPEALQGKDIKVDFVSILSQMQRMVGIGQDERVVSFIGNLAAVHPEAADKLNTDAAIDEYAERAGSSPKIIRSDDEVAKIRDARQQSEQQQKMAAAMPAVKDGADAARLLSEAAKNGGIPGMGMAA